MYTLSKLFIHLSFVRDNFHIMKPLKLALGMLFAFWGSSLFAQTVSGVVSDENGIPLPGLSVVIEGTTTGTTTDMDGKYSLKLPEAGTYKLVFSYLGYTKSTQEVKVGDGETKSLTFNMQPSAEALDEFVVVGYGVQRKRDVTGNIAQVSGAELVKLPVPSFEAALQGQASGVMVTQGSGLAGSSSLIRIRGIASISAGGDPLYVVDGIPITNTAFITGNAGGMNNNPLAALNPNDIESVEILKDASATGIYGSRGANGVVLITTKRGTNKEGQWNFKAGFGTSQPAARANMLNSEEYMQMRQEAWENDGGTGHVYMPYGPFNAGTDAAVRDTLFQQHSQYDTDWWDETTRIGIKQDYSLSYSKKGDKLGRFFNGSYNNNGSYIDGNSFERASVRANFDYKFNDKLKGTFSTGLARTVNNRVNAAWSGGLGAAMSTALPIYPIRYDEDVYDENDSLIHAAGDYWLEAGIGNNPVAQAELTDWKNREIRSISNASLTYTPIKDLVIRASGGYEWMDIREDKWEGPEVFQNPAWGQGFANQKNNSINNYNMSLTANYLKDIGEDHKFNFLVGTEYQRSRNDQNEIKAIFMDGPLSEFDQNNDSLRQDIKKPSEIHAFLSYFGRVNYKLKDKYIFQGTARVDGSSRFGRNSKYGFFPSASAGWIISEEDFLKDNRIISYLKAKVSWGVTGNANIPNFEWIGTYQPPQNSNPYNGEPIIYPIRLENPDLKWETAQTIDVGVEIGFFKDRITTELSAYNKLSTDVLMQLTVPRYFGFENYWDNVGSILNRGIELSIKSVNIDKKFFQWTTNFNIAYNYNEILSIRDYSPDAVSGGTNDTRVVVGSPVGTNYLVRFSHIDAEGLPVYLDIDGNETYQWDPSNRVAVGDILPDAVGGLTNTFKYKNWSLSGLFYYSFGGKIYDSSSKRQLGVVTNWNMRRDLFDRWRTAGDEENVAFPRLTLLESTYGSTTPWINTDMWLHDGSYIRLRRVTLSYTLPEVNISSISLKNVVISATGTNLWLWTRFPGLDPEIARDFENDADRNMSGNITYLTPPQERSFMLNLSCSF
jgi:TonB-linked SusC/RagA family outer membrane protein